MTFTEKAHREKSR